MRYVVCLALLLFAAPCFAAGGHHSHYQSGYGGGYSPINRGPGYTGGIYDASNSGYGSYGYSAYGNYFYLYGYSAYVGGLNDSTPAIGIPSVNWNAPINQGQLPNLHIQHHR